MATTDTLPPRSTRPLPDAAGSVYDIFAKVLTIVWRVAFGHTLDEWQANLLRLVTELRPDGTLRHRQFLISMGRQNGKTEIAAALGLLFMLWKARCYIVGIASSADQARLVYKRTMDAIKLNRSLAAKFSALTETRGIRSKTGGLYEIKAAKSASLQGIPLDLGIVDEVHLVKPSLWSDLVNGLGRRLNVMVVGITTAGDDTSALLKHLYRLADEGKIGHAIYEAPTAEIPEDDATLARYILAANPSIAYGYARDGLKIAIETVRTTPPADALRYILNRFVAAENDYITVGAWAPRAVAGMPMPEPGSVVFGIDRTPTWTHAAIVAAWPDGDTVRTQVVASIAAPDIDKIVDVAVELQPWARLFVGDSYSLGPVMKALTKRGATAKAISLGDLTGATSRLFSRVMTGTIEHAGDPLITRQLGNVKTKSVGDAMRLVRASKDGDIDAVVAMSEAVYFVEAMPDESDQLFV